MIGHIFDCVKSANRSAFREARGGTEDECRALEKAAGVPLPRAYAQFITLMGRSTGVNLVRNYDFSIISMIDHLRVTGGAINRLPVAIGGEPDSISLALSSSKDYHDPFVHFSWEDELEAVPDLVVAPSFSSFLARSLFCEGVLKRQKYVHSLVPAVTPLYLKLTSVINFDLEAQALLTDLGASRFFGALDHPAYIAADGYICYVRWPGRRTFGILTGSSNQAFSGLVKRKFSKCLKLEMEEVDN